MATIGYAQLPVPGGGDAPTWPAALAELATAIDPHLWQHVTNKAQRDTLYSGAPVNTAVLAANGSVWVKTSATANTWATVWEPLEAWRAVTPASGYQGGEFAPVCRIDRGRVHLRGRLTRVDGTVFPTSGVKIGSVPADCKPAAYGSWAGGASLSGDPAVGVGRLEVLGLQSSTSLGGVGDIIWYSQDGTGVPWVDLSGYYWLD
ncbi:hypothetical protein [Streptomyces sp. NRRL S-15]|uniref:hypothetical protein n=1 Tax=Streptomyces sp. NRRL S-15 TaxID=1463886 RepID=UPI0004C8C844|nr:hypothetical protein [Streptomyces sp. NRRL S-15]